MSWSSADPSLVKVPAAAVCVVILAHFAAAITPPRELHHDIYSVCVTALCDARGGISPPWHCGLPLPISRVLHFLDLDLKTEHGDIPRTRSRNLTFEI